MYRFCAARQGFAALQRSCAGLLWEFHTRNCECRDSFLTPNKAHHFVRGRFDSDPLRIESGMAIPSDAPGSGVSWNEDAVAKFSA